MRAESYSGIRCGVDQAVLDSKNHGGLLLGRVDLVLVYFNRLFLIQFNQFKSFKRLKTLYPACLN